MVTKNIYQIYRGKKRLGKIVTKTMRECVEKLKWLYSMDPTFNMDEYLIVPIGIRRFDRDGKIVKRYGTLLEYLMDGEIV